MKMEEYGGWKGQAVNGIRGRERKSERKRKGKGGRKMDEGNKSRGTKGILAEKRKMECIGQAGNRIRKEKKKKKRGRSERSQGGRGEGDEGTEKGGINGMKEIGKRMMEKDRQLRE